MNLVNTERLREIAEVEFADIVVESDLSQVPEEALRQFLMFARNKLSS